MRILPLLLCGIAACVCAPSAVGAEYLVAVDDGVNARALARAEDQRGNDVDAVYRHVGAVVLDLDAADVRRLRADNRVAAIQPNRPVRIAGTRPDVGWNLARIDQPRFVNDGVYDFDATGIGVTAYVLDTGLTASHVEFAGRVGTGFSAVGDGLGTTDCHGHGTHVAGILGGDTRGVAPDVTIVPVRVMNCAGAGSTETVVAGIDWMIAQHGAGQPAVANLSIGGGPSPVMDLAIADAVADGITVAVAAGNESADACGGSPARAPSAITVAASDAEGSPAGLVDVPAYYSNRGRCVDLFAPGSDVVSAWLTGKRAVAELSGTSMATPHVAGVAALVLERTPSATPAAVGTAISGMAVANALARLSPGTPNLLLQSRPLPPLAPDVPTAPRRLSGKPTDGTVTLTWQEPADPAGSPIVGYDLKQTVDGVASIRRVIGTAATADDLANDVAATFSVRAVNAVGKDGAWSAPLTITPAAPPPNDAMAAPRDLEWATATVTGSTLTATAEPGETGSDGEPAAASVWYRLPPVEDGIMRISTAGSDFDTVISVYDDAGKPLSGNDDAAFARGDVTSAVELRVTVGETYRIAVDGWDGARGAVRLSWSMRPPGTYGPAAITPSAPDADVEVAVPPRPRILRATIIRGRFVRLRITPVPGARYQVLRNGKVVLTTRSVRPLLRLGKGQRTVFRVRVVTAAGGSRLSAAVIVRRNAVKGL